LRTPSDSACSSKIDWFSLILHRHWLRMIDLQHRGAESESSMSSTHPAALYTLFSGRL
jgi:hypothetical protein